MCVHLKVSAEINRLFYFVGYLFDDDASYFLCRTSDSYAVEIDWVHRLINKTGFPTFYFYDQHQPNFSKGFSKQSQQITLNVCIEQAVGQLQVYRLKRP